MPLVALLVCAGEIGVPTGIPVEVALLLAGAYAVHSLPALVAGVLLVALADLLGTTTLHLVVRTGGVRLMERLLRRHDARREDAIGRWRRRLGGRDAAVVFVVRLLPLARMWVSIGAGLLRVRFRSFLLGAAPAALLWAGTPLVLGYAFRGDVHRWEARYTTGAHLLLAALPAVGLLTGLAWWIGGGHSLRASVHRGRSALGLIAAVATTAYLVKLAWANEWAVEHGAAALPRPLLLLWLGILASLALVLLGFAYADLRAARLVRPPRDRATGGAVAEFARTVLWLGLLGATGVIPFLMEQRYPVL